MINDFVEELFSIINSFSKMGYTITDIVDFFNDNVHYFYEFLGLIKNIQYFVPEQHFNNLLGLSIGSVVIRATISAYKLLNPVK